MSENTPYFDSITSHRSVEQFNENEQSALEGMQLLSGETRSNEQEQGILTFLQNNLPSFFHHVRVLSSRDQDLLMSYYFLGKTQNQLAVVFKNTQTVCSFQIRAAVAALTAIILFGGKEPTAKIIEPILDAAGLAHPTLKGEGEAFGFPQPDTPNLTKTRRDVKVPLAQLIIDYMKCENFGVVAMKYGVHRPEVRRTLSRLSKALRKEDQGQNQQALGWWVFKLIDKKAATGTGLSKRQLGKEGDLHLKDPACLGDFRIAIGCVGWKHMFEGRASW